jgi:hypothetical protein
MGLHAKPESVAESGNPENLTKSAIADVEVHFYSTL